MNFRNIRSQIRLFLEHKFPRFFPPKAFVMLEKELAKKPALLHFHELEIYVLNEVLPSNATIWDVGSNVGMYLYFLQKYGKNYQLLGFEPIPYLYQRLTSLFKKLNIYQIALSNVDATQQFKIPLIQDIAYHTRGTLNVDFKEEGENAAQSFEVKTQKADSFWEEWGKKKIDLIKIDVEGHEWEVLKGATNIMEMMSPIFLVEIEQRHHLNHSIQLIFEYMQAREYEGFYIDKLTGKILSVKELDISNRQKIHQISTIYYVNNFIFLKKKDHAYLHHIQLVINQLK